MPSPVPPIAWWAVGPAGSIWVLAGRPDIWGGNFRKEKSGMNHGIEKDWQTNMGVGPIKTLELPAEIDQTMAESGRVVYEAKCTACHKPEKDFIGPAPKGIMDRRTAAWVMNMIIDPEGMIAKDPIARELLIKFNGAPMANQNLTEEEARSVLEYFRTL